MNLLRSSVALTLTLCAGNLRAAPTPSPVKGAEASVHDVLTKDPTSTPSPNDKSRQAQRDLTALFKGADAVISALLEDPYNFSLGDRLLTPAEAIAQNRFIALAGELFGWDSLLWLR